jgi:UDP-N-acetylglucosamine:LPS N-acetylglucosamine transferase
MAIQPIAYARKKKILVLVSRGGGGHKTAAEALQQILGDSYDIEINYVFEDILRTIDTLSILTQGKYTGEDLYNFLLKNHQKKLLQWMIEGGKKAMSPRRIEKAFDHFLKEQVILPDLIISPTPFINYGAALAAHRYDIPYLIIPTDLDGSTFLNGFPSSATPLNIKLALAYNDPLIRERTIQNKQLREEQILVTGFPVKPACCRKYSSHEKQQIRSEFHLFESHKTITLVMGAVGGNLIFNHVKSMLALDPRMHGLHLELNVCTGHNRKMGDKISSLLHSYGARSLNHSAYILPSGLVVHVREYVFNLIDLMAVSDLIITKTGSCTVNEAIYLEKKVILDNTERSTARYLPWEEFNIPFVEKYGLGVSFSDSRQLPMLIPSLIKYPEKTKSSLERPPFEENLRSLVRSMID